MLFLFRAPSFLAEPFEEFSASPTHDHMERESTNTGTFPVNNSLTSTITISNNLFFPTFPLTVDADDHFPLPAFTRGGRSPGFKMGMGSRTLSSNSTRDGSSPSDQAPSPVKEYFADANGNVTSPGNGVAARSPGVGGASVKRTRSLMQRFKAMVSIRDRGGRVQW